MSENEKTKVVEAQVRVALLFGATACEKGRCPASAILDEMADHWLAKAEATEKK